MGVVLNKVMVLKLEDDESPVAPLCLQVKADKDSGNLHRLQHASRGVTQATAAVVASTKSGKSQIEEKGERTVWLQCF